MTLMRGVGRVAKPQAVDEEMVYNRQLMNKEK